MMRISLLTSALVPLLLAGCNDADPVERNSAPADVTVLPPDESTADIAATNAAAEELPDALIPTALHGRWGLVPADCEPGRSDAKGLLTISGDQLRFYESVARPSPGVQRSPNSVSGNFAFTGEGMEWTKYQTLELQDGKLIRTESAPNETSYTYVRC